MKAKEHWSKKLRRELETARAELREVCLNPQSGHSLIIGARERADDRMRQMVMSGSPTYGATGGKGLIPMIEKEGNLQPEDKKGITLEKLKEQYPGIMSKNDDLNT